MENHLILALLMEAGMVAAMDMLLVLESLEMVVAVEPIFVLLVLCILVLSLQAAEAAAEKI